jgi:DNA-binding MarR family transcriptional regulator
MADVTERASVPLAELAEGIDAARKLDRRLNAILAEDGLRLDLWRIMQSLALQPGMLMSEIAVKLTIPAGTVTRFVDELSDATLVFRGPSPEDGRRTLVYLSRAGRERLERASTLLAARLDSAE